MKKPFWNPELFSYLMALEFANARTPLTGRKMEHLVFLRGELAKSEKVV